MNNELYHHGVKGMKWGVRNEPDRVGSQRKIKAKDLPATKKSNHRRELELRYRQSGMTRKEAIDRADKRIRVEKILVASAAVTATAAVTAVAVHNYKERSKEFFQIDQPLQRMVRGDGSDEKLNEYEFYATYKKKDNLRYGRYAYQLANGKGSAWGKGAEGASKLSITRDGGLKVAKEETSSKIFGELWKNDPEFRSDVLKSFPKGRHNFANNGNKKQREMYMAVYRNRHNDNPSVGELKKMYRAWNINAVADHGEHGQAVMAKMREAHQSRGLQGIVDVNDMHFSGYKASRPVIAFADSQANYTVNATKLSKKTTKGMNFVGSSIIGFDNIRKGRPAAGIAGAAAIGTASVAANKSRIIQQYKKEHPNTRLTNSQIYSSYTKRKKK